MGRMRLHGRKSEKASARPPVREEASARPPVEEQTPARPPVGERIRRVAGGYGG